MLIDTRRAVRDLTEGDSFTEEQADKLVDVVSSLDESVATKADLQALETRLTQRIYTSVGLLAALLTAFEFLA